MFYGKTVINKIPKKLASKSCFINPTTINDIVSRLHNLKHFNNIEIVINNPLKVNKNNILTKFIYSVRICIIKDDLYLQKLIENNDIELVLNETDNFMNKNIDI
jgi:hypothetical protein